MEDFLGELMTNEFDTVVEDGSLPQVSMSWTQLPSPCLQSFFSQSIYFRPRFLIPTIPKSCTRILDDYLLPNGKSLIILRLSKPCLYSFISLHTSFLGLFFTTIARAGQAMYISTPALVTITPLPGISFPFTSYIFQTQFQCLPY